MEPGLLSAVLGVVLVQVMATHDLDLQKVAFLSWLQGAGLL